MAKDLEVLEVMRRHGRAMASMDPDFIAQDYADDAVVICNLVEKPAVGRAAIRDMIAQILKMAFMEQCVEDPQQTGADEDVLDIGEGEYCLHMFTNRAMGMTGVESYQVRDNKIVFESAAMQKIK